MAFGVAKGSFRQVNTNHLGLRNLQGERPGDAAGARTKVQHARGGAAAQFRDGLRDQLLRLGTRYQHARAHGEAVSAELGESQHILDGFSPAQPLQVAFQFRQAPVGHGGLRLDDMGIGGGAQPLRAEHQNQTPRLRRRVQGLKTGDAVADEVGEQH